MRKLNVEDWVCAKCERKILRTLVYYDIRDVNRIDLMKQETQFKSKKEATAHYQTMRKLLGESHNAFSVLLSYEP